MRKIVASIFLLLSSLSLAESYYYRGIMGDGLPIQMQLELNDTEIYGSYYYDAYGIPIELRGSLEGARVNLAEFSQEEGETVQTGSFSGSFTDSDFGQHFTGEWVNSYGNLFNFSLEKVADYVSVEVKQAQIEASNTYPYFTISRLEPINQLLQETFLQRQFDFVREGQDMLKAGELHNGWLLDSSTSIHYLSGDGLVSMLETIYAYTGGAHGNTGFVSHNLLLDSSGIRILELRDMFAARSDFMTVLSPLIIEDLRGQMASWVIEGSVTEVTEADLQTFVISPLGLEFYFEPYRMGAYVEGSYQVLLTYDRLLEFIDESSPLFRFLPHSQP
ncbi:MAG: DUF3298 and DUF4163 domain-containing protein [Trueperaceae bacterium]|nr:DUF3298 and DUF4163 domain-containing protein [Trueperaceae bacterium]